MNTVSYINLLDTLKRSRNIFVALVFVLTQVFVPLSMATELVNAAGTIDVSNHEGQLKDGDSGDLIDYTTGSSNITTYTELDSINFRFDIEADGDLDGQMQIEFTSNDTGCLFFDGSFGLGTHDNSADALTNVSGSEPVVTTAGSANNDNNDWVQVLNVDFAGAGSATVNYYLTLTDEAGECSSGSPQHSRLGNGPEPGDFKNIGGQNIPIPSKEIIELPEIFVQKWIDEDGDGETDRPALESEWFFSLDGGERVPTDENGEVVFNNVTPDGEHTITEHDGPSSQSFISGSGENCEFDEGVATATVAQGTTATNAICIFNNGLPAKGSISIIKNAVPNNLTDFDFSITGDGIDEEFTLDDDYGVTDADNEYDNEKTFSGLSAGTYTFTEDGAAGWDLTEISCNRGATVERDLDAGTLTVTLSAGEDVECTFRNEQRGQIVVNKVTDPADDAIPFSISLSTGDGTDYSEATPTTVATDAPAIFTVGHGSYSISEDEPAGWKEVSNTCSNLTINGLTELVDGVPTVECTITNEELASLTIVKDALPVDNQVFGFTTTGLTPATFDLSDNDADTTESSRTFSDLTPGETFTVTEDPTTGWELTDLSCIGDGATVNLGDREVSYTPAAGDDVNCTFTNTQLLSIGGIKYLWSENGISQQTADSPWTIELLRYDQDADDFVYQADTTTDPNDGGYSFTDLLPGIYQLRELAAELEEGWTQTMTPADIGLEPGDAVDDADFENFEHASVSGYKWNDVNGDGEKAEDEPKIADWGITLEKKNANGEWAEFDTADTDSDGDYSFDGLTLLEVTDNQQNISYEVPEYRVCEEDRSPAWEQTHPADGDCHELTITSSGQLVDEQNFGNQGQGTITLEKTTDTIDESEDASFTFSFSDSNIADVTIETTGSETVAASPIDVAAGNYDITETAIENGWSFKSVTCRNTDEQNWTAGSGQVNVEVNPGDDVTCTFVNTRDTGTITVDKTVVGAEDDDGLFDLLVNGVVEEEDAADGGTTNAVTVATGTHSVSELAGSETSLDDYNSTYVCTVNGDNLTSGSGTSVADISVSKDSDIVCTFTNTRYLSIGGIKYIWSASGNVRADMSWTFTLEELNNDSEMWNEVDETTSSNNDGSYNFSGLLPGIQYRVSESIESLSDWIKLTPVADYFEYNLEPGQNVTQANFTNYETGSVSGYKWSDANGDGQWNEGEEPIEDWTISLQRQEGETWVDFPNADENTVETDANGQYQFDELTLLEENEGEFSAPTYRVCEEGRSPDWEQTYPADGNCHELTITESGQEFIGDSGVAEEFNFGNRGFGTILVEKTTLTTSGDATTFNFDINSIDYDDEYSIGPISVTAQSTESAELITVAAGTYEITEDAPEGWILVGSFCSTETSADRIIVRAGGEVSCTFLNQELATVNVTKFNDFNGNGVWGEDIEPTLPDWEMTLACELVLENGDEGIRALPAISDGFQFFSPRSCLSDRESELELLQTIDNEFTDSDGVATFSGLLAGPYTFSEVEQDGWQQTGIYCEIDGELVPGNQMNVFPGQTRECFIGNAQDLVLNLEKENDTPDVSTVGDIVTYTLTVSVPEDSGVSYNTTVVDVPPENFLVDNTTTTSTLISSPNRPGSQAFAGGGTTYASPGTWSLGTLYPGDVVELTYQAEIQENVSPGTYPDIAYARGDTVPELEENETVYSNVHLAQADDPFVSTDVTVAVDRPQVLGATTTLAETGSPITWQYAAVPILLIGLAASLVRRETKGAL